MQVRCPKCDLDLEVPEQATDPACPHCGAGLEVAMGGGGFLLMAEAGPAPQDCQAPLTCPASQPSPPGDPVLEDHHRWRAGSFFAMASGIVGLAVLAFMTVGDWRTHGMAFYRRGDNMLLLAAAAVFCVLLIAGGSALYVMVGRETRRYLETLNQRRKGNTP